MIGPDGIQIGVPVSLKGPPPGTPLVFAVRRPTPSPFTSFTTTSFDLPATTGQWKVSARMYNVAGRVVKTLLNGSLAPGTHAVMWDGRDDHGMLAASGVYFLQVEIPGHHQQVRTVFLR